MSENRLSFLLLCGIALMASMASVAYSKPKPTGNVPKYIRMCKKDDPELDKCLKRLFESIRPKLSEGIPEIGLPPLEPLLLKEIVVLRGGNGQTKAIGHDIKVTGISGFKLNYIKANVEKLEVDVSISFPALRFEGTYDVNAKFVNMPVIGKGPIRGNATDITAKALLKAKFMDGKEGKFVEFHSAVLDVNVKDYSVRVDHLFPDKQLNDAINVLINDRKLQSLATAKPIINKLAATMLLEMVNKIAKNVNFEEVFA